MATFKFEELEVYQAVRAFRARINKLVKLLPAEEKFRLCQQMRRAALTVTNCIAEGHGRYTFKDRIHFSHESRGSLQELVDDMNECADCGYAKAAHLEDLRADARRLLQLIDGYVRYLRKQHQQGLQKVKQSPAKKPNHALTNHDLTTIGKT